jgi:hypothetical protein
LAILFGNSVWQFSLAIQFGNSVRQFSSAKQIQFDNSGLVGNSVWQFSFSAVFSAFQQIDLALMGLTIQLGNLVPQFSLVI